MHRNYTALRVIFHKNVRWLTQSLRLRPLEVGYEADVVVVHSSCCCFSVAFAFTMDWWCSGVVLGACCLTLNNLYWSNMESTVGPAHRYCCSCRTTWKLQQQPEATTWHVSLAAVFSQLFVSFFRQTSAFFCTFLVAHGWCRYDILAILSQVWINVEWFY